MDDRAVFERHECLLHAIACLTAAKAVPRAIVHYTHAGEMEQHGGGAIVSSSEKPCRSLRLVAESYALTLLLKHLTSRSEDDEARVLVHGMCLKIAAHLEAVLGVCRTTQTLALHHQPTILAASHSGYRMLLCGILHHQACTLFFAATTRPVAFFSLPPPGLVLAWLPCLHL